MGPLKYDVFQNLDLGGGGRQRKYCYLITGKEAPSF